MSLFSSLYICYLYMLGTKTTYRHPALPSRIPVYIFKCSMPADRSHWLLLQNNKQQKPIQFCLWEMVPHLRRDQEQRTMIVSREGLASKQKTYWLLEVWLLDIFLKRWHTCQKSSIWVLSEWPVRVLFHFNQLTNL